MVLYLLLGTTGFPVAAASGFMAVTPSGPLRPSSGPKWAKRADYGVGPLERKGGILPIENVTKISRSNFPIDSGAQSPIRWGFRGGGYFPQLLNVH